VMVVGFSALFEGPLFGWCCYALRMDERVCWDLESFPDQM
jgi:hypothetical protein